MATIPYFWGDVRKFHFLGLSKIQRRRKNMTKKKSKKEIQSQPNPWKQSPQGLQITRASEFFSSFVHQLLLPCPNYCTSERELQSTQPVEMYTGVSLYAPHWSQEGDISHLEILPQCPKAWNTSNKTPTEICQCGTRFASLSWCLSSCFLNTSFVAVGMSALKSSISLSTENAHCFLSFKISSKYLPVSN